MTPVDPKTDLMFERVIDVAPELVWKAWTTPEHLKKWFTPVPWKTVDCEIDLRPGGKFYTLMESPEGQHFPNTGCYLEIVPNAKLVWTGALLPGFRPANLSADVPFVFTAVIELEPHGAGTKYTATVLHSNEEGRVKHEAMGFHHGWGTALDQLVALAKGW
jgi:uncharacterized protein YndB with AHSA1/START domain